MQIFCHSISRFDISLMNRRLLIASCAAAVLSFGTSCLPLVSYSARVDPNQVTVRGEQGSVLLEPKEEVDSRAVKQTYLPLGFGPVRVQLERSADGATDLGISGCPDGTYNRRYRLVAPSGDLIESETLHTFSGGKLIWNYHASPFSRLHAVGASLCIATGTLETDQAHVQWLRKTTYGSKSSGILGLIVGGFITTGGAIGVERGIREELRPLTYIGVSLTTLGLLVLTLGIYHLVRPTTIETLFVPAARMPPRGEP